MTLTADQKKKVAVALLIPAAAYMVYSNILSTGGPTPPPVAYKQPIVRGDIEQRKKRLHLAREHLDVRQVGQIREPVLRGAV